jgi:outer membrane protein OmpA-like peptidoglycan-associated protein
MYLMKQIIIGLLVFFVWLGISIYWYVCGIKDLCEKPKTVVTILGPDEELEELDEVEEEFVEEPVEPLEEIVIEEHKDTVLELPTLYFLFEVSSVKNVDDMINASKLAREYLSENPNKILYITGHTCNLDKTGKNYQVGMDRALAIKSYMVSKGIYEDNIVTMSKGADEPIADNNTREGRMLNRRVEMIVK